MNYLPSLKQLQYLVALADEKSFSQAADFCYVTQPTLSAGISALENLLNEQLVDRTHKNVTLTPLGQETVERSRKIIEEANAIVERIKYAKSPMAGPVRIGMIPTIAPYLIPLIIPFFQSKYPMMEIQIKEELSARIVEHLERGSLDLAVMAFPYDTGKLKTIKLFDEAFVLATPKQYWKKTEKIELNQLEGHNLLLLEEGHCLRDHALAACKIQPPENKKTFSATSLATILQMVRQGYGITLLPEMAIKHKFLPEGIDIYEFTQPKPIREIGLACRANSPRLDTFEKISDEIINCIND
jgi:LysR family hydrogen peroxide-inducible transcriptional activator